MEKASRKIISMPVYSINEGHYLGHVKSLVIDPAEKKLLALVVEQRQWGKEEKIVPFSKVQHLGEDVITIDRTQSLQRRTNIPQILQNMHHPLQIYGVKVLTDMGKTLGKIEEYYVFTQNGSITMLEISNSVFRNRLALKGEDIITIATAAIIVANKISGELVEMERPLAETMLGAKEAATSIGKSAIRAGKKFSQTIANSLNKYKEAQQEEPGEQASPEEIPQQQIIEVMTEKEVVIDTPQAPCPDENEFPAVSSEASDETAEQHDKN